jgi:hypothetical protein
LNRIAFAVAKRPPKLEKVWSTALASYPECTMQLAHFGLPLAWP